MLALDEVDGCQKERRLEDSERKKILRRYRLLEKKN